MSSVRSIHYAVNELLVTSCHHVSASCVIMSQPHVSASCVILYEARSLRKHMKVHHHSLVRGAMMQALEGQALPTLTEGEGLPLQEVELYQVTQHMLSSCPFVCLAGVWLSVSDSCCMAGVFCVCPLID